MTHELFYTSAQRGLQPGSRGFCTVACTRGMPAPLIEKVEALSGYRPVFAPHDAKAALNPVAWSHFRLSLGGQSYHVLSRVCAAGLDYTDRTNKFAHHIILDAGELPPGGPAWLLGQPRFMETAWNGKVETLPAGRTPPRGDAPPAPCRAWQKLTGDAGWAGVLAETFLKDANKSVYLLFEPGTDVLPLLAEALALVPIERRWEVTFSTYLSNLPAGLACTWRGVTRESPEAAAARQNPHNLVLTLGPGRGRASGGPLVESARTGKVAAGPIVLPPTPGYVVREVASESAPPAPREQPQRLAPIGMSAPIAPTPAPAPAPEMVQVMSMQGLDPPPAPWKSFSLGAVTGTLLSFGIVAAVVVLAPELVAPLIGSPPAPTAVRETARPRDPDETRQPSKTPINDLPKVDPDDARVFEEAVNRRKKDKDVEDEALKDLKKDAKLRKEAIEEWKKDKTVKEDALLELKKSEALKTEARNELKKGLQKDEAVRKEAKESLIDDQSFRKEVARELLTKKDADASIVQAAVEQLSSNPALMEQAAQRFFKEFQGGIWNGKELEKVDAPWYITRDEKAAKLAKGIDLGKYLSIPKPPPKKPLEFELSIVPELPKALGKSTGTSYTLVPDQSANTLTLNLEVKQSDQSKQYEIGTFAVSKNNHLSFKVLQPERGEPRDAMRQVFALIQNRLLEVKLKDSGQHCVIALRSLGQFEPKGKPTLQTLMDNLTLARKEADVLTAWDASNKVQRPPLYCGPLFVEVSLGPPDAKGGFTQEFNILNESFELFMNVNGRRVVVSRVGAK